MSRQVVGRWAIALAAGAMAIILSGCGGGASTPGSQASQEIPGAGRKPASGAWLDHQYGEWEGELTSPTEGRYSQWEAYNFQEQSKQPSIVVQMTKYQDLDVRLLATPVEGGDPVQHGEAWCIPQTPICYVQLLGGYVHLMGNNNTTAAEVGALATEMYAGFSDDPDEPVPTASPTPDNPGAGRKPAAGAKLPDQIGDFRAMNPGSGSGAYLPQGATRLSDGGILFLHVSDDANAKQRASMISPATQHGEAWCDAKSTSMTCYVQLDGGIIQVMGGANQSPADTAKLANAAYEAL